MTKIKWVRYPKPNPQAKFRLFCLPYAGSGAAIFRTWPTMLPPEIELGFILLPGREGRFQEAPIRECNALVQPLAEALLPELNKPFVIFGHSMGAVVGFELARLLRQRYGLTPRHLFMSARNAPQLRDLRPHLHGLPVSEFLMQMRQRYDGIPEAIWENKELLDLFLPTLRADLTLIEQYCYTPAPPLACPVTVFGSPHDPNTTPEALAAWREQTQGEFQLHLIEGSHFFLNEQPQLLLQYMADGLTI